MGDPVNVSKLCPDDWEHALVTGNGRQGAACYGGPAAVRVTLSHERLFLPVDEPLEPPDTGAALPRLRDLLYAGQFQAAADEVMAIAIRGDARYRELRQSDPFIGAATVTFTADRARDEGWRRSVDHRSGLVTQRCAGLRQDVFVSRPHDLVVIRLRAQRRQRRPTEQRRQRRPTEQLRRSRSTEYICGRLHLGPIAGPIAAPPVPIAFTSTATPDRMRLRAAFPRQFENALAGYTVDCRVRASGGRIEVNLADTSLHIRNAYEVLLLIRTTVGQATGAEDPAMGFDELLVEHTTVHRGLFDRCRLELGSTRGGTGTGMTTEQLVGGAVTPELVETLFDAGRYTVICASGTLPPNLQGVWSGTFTPAWRGGYTLDGNLATALAAAGPTGTPELLLPLFDLVEAHLPDFRDNAWRLHRMPGILVPPHLTSHGRHNHFTARWCLTFWTAGAAWLARLYYDYWRFTGDRAFLRNRALPFMREAAAFYTAFATGDGTFCFAPSYSPENEPLGTHSQAAVNATMDVAAVRDLMTNLHEATGEGRWRTWCARLPQYQVDPGGTLAEWLWPGLRDNHAHRHASGLFGLWYEPDPALLDDRRLRRAATESVRGRLGWWRGGEDDEGGDEMAFGLVQLGLAAASLGLAEEAYEALCRLATRYWRPNLVSTHNVGAIFNTDICGGLPALVTSMLVSARGNQVWLLPALPAAWPAGSIHGALLRGGVRVDRLSWSGDLVEVELSSREDAAWTVCASDQSPVAVSLRAGQVQRVTFPVRPSR